jgi:hypothetical protein
VFEIGFGRALSAFLDCLEQNRRNIQLEVLEILVSHAYTLDGLPYLFGTPIVIAGMVDIADVAEPVVVWRVRRQTSRIGVSWGPACAVERKENRPPGVRTSARPAYSGAVPTTPLPRTKAAPRSLNQPG